MTDYSDWEHTVWGRGHRNRLPHSCCESTETGVCRPSAADDAVLIRVGCHTRIVNIIEEHSIHIISLLLLATLIHGAAVTSSFFLARSKHPYHQMDEFQISAQSHNNRRWDLFTVFAMVHFIKI